MVDLSTTGLHFLRLGFLYWFALAKILLAVIL
jgi:hypothetical protein